LKCCRGTSYKRKPTSQYNCKAGRCSSCENACKRCGCACDGINPASVKKRKSINYVVCPEPRQSLEREVRKGTDKLNAEAILADQTDSNSENEKLSFIGAHELFEMFGISKTKLGNLPNIETRNKDANFLETPSGPFSTMVNAIHSVSRSVASVLIPADPDGLMTKFLDSCSKNRVPVNPERFEAAATQVYMNAQRGSKEKRVAQAVLAKVISNDRHKYLKSKIPGFHFQRKAVSRGRIDFEFLSENGNLPVINWSSQKPMWQQSKIVWTKIQASSQV